MCEEECESELESNPKPRPKPKPLASLSSAVAERGVASIGVRSSETCVWSALIWSDCVCVYYCRT